MIRAEQWVQLEQEARECPVLQTYVNYAKVGHQSREDALVAAVLHLSRDRRELLAERARTMRMMQNAPPGLPAPLVG